MQGNIGSDSSTGTAQQLTRPQKTQPDRVGNFDLRGSVNARLAGMIMVNVTQLMTSSNRLETRVDRVMPPLQMAANSAEVRSANAECGR